MILSIDPGTDTGWALWRAGRLAACGFGCARLHPLHVVAPRNQHDDAVHDVWIEDQEIYPRNPVPPQDVLALAKLAHFERGLYTAVGCTVHMVLPRTWKGQTPCTCGRKNGWNPAACTHHSRVWAKLSAAEQIVADHAITGMAPSKRHNVLDAVGIGQWAVGKGQGT